MSDAQTRRWEAITGVAVTPETVSTIVARRDRGELFTAIAQEVGLTMGRTRRLYWAHYGRRV